MGSSLLTTMSCRVVRVRHLAKMLVYARAVRASAHQTAKLARSPAKYRTQGRAANQPRISSPTCSACSERGRRNSKGPCRSRTPARGVQCETLYCGSSAQPQATSPPRQRQKGQISSFLLGRRKEILHDTDHGSSKPTLASESRTETTAMPCTRFLKFPLRQPLQKLPLCYSAETCSSAGRRYHMGGVESAQRVPFMSPRKCHQW